MFTIKNPILEKAIRDSYVLRTRLNAHQIEVFIERALQLPDKNQHQLLQKLQNESQTLQENRKKIVEKHAQKTEKILRNAKKEIFHNAEKHQEKNDHTYSKNLLSNLKKA